MGEEWDGCGTMRDYIWASVGTEQCFIKVSHAKVRRVQFFQLGGVLVLVWEKNGIGFGQKMGLILGECWDTFGSRI